MLLLSTLLTKSNQYLETLASYKQLSRWTKLADRTLKGLIKSLVEAGWLKYHRGSTGFSNVYQIQTAKLRPHAKFFIPETQNEVSRYQHGRRELTAEVLAFNTKSRPRVLTESEDISILEPGTYFVKPDDSEVYLLRYEGDKLVVRSMRELSDYDRAYTSRIRGFFKEDHTVNDIDPSSLPY